MTFVKIRFMYGMPAITVWSTVPLTEAFGITKVRASWLLPSRF